ncbi:hypothetical protein [Mangrovimonas sp. YM274]|uniref:hypothetical protein n=1 Tax=Mangrovimonas sp. YM274 TaxID=3070660 RepID=UPI0027DEAA00|nr:hypothetical protein [Mangrovimonas sp. YM274]WMI70044.1 hypothetical protein RBH95_06765 [Mangrovimonas sp. YM274]
MNFDVLLKTRLFLVFFFSFLLASLLGDALATMIKLNQTIGWQLQIINSPIDFFTAYLPLLYFTFYLILSVLKINTNLFWSKIHFTSFVISITLMSFTDINFNIIYLATGISFIIFIVNAVVSLKN